MSDAERLASAERAFIVAPAGCGKTHLIAASLEHCHGRQLVLTHTNAGVDVLRTRMIRFGTASALAHVETIASFALRFAMAYPSISGVVVEQPRTTEQWGKIYAGAARVLASRVGRAILTASYTGVFVDEYQDCSLAQHALVTQLAEVLPCRVLGDPLQAIFQFEKDTIVNWSSHVESQFTALPVTIQPWRWKLKNPALGAWLMEVRTRFEQGGLIDLAKAPLNLVILDPKQASRQRRDACFGATRRNGTVVAIQQWPAQCHDLAGQLGGAYTSIEPIEANDLFVAASNLQDSRGDARALAVMAFAKLCATKVGTELATLADAFAAGRAGTARIRKHHDVRQSLLAVCATSDMAPILPALRACVGVQGAAIKRRDLYSAMVRTLQEYDPAVHEDLGQVAWQVRYRTSITGRTPYERVVSRTLLVKGLEYDHAIVLDAGALPAEHLYVAMTRGAKSLTVLSGSNVIDPRAQS